MNLKIICEVIKMYHELCEKVVSAGHSIHKCQFIDGFDISVDGVQVVSVRGLTWHDRIMRTSR